MIEVKNISLSFDNKTLFDNLSFSIPENKHTCITGASGKGKSTILKMTQGYIEPDKGGIRVDSLLVSRENIKKIREKLVWVPQNINLSVDSGEELMNLLEVDDREKVITNLEFLGLSKKDLELSFDKLSGGQKQRMVISVCLALGRSILLLDEPTSALDDASISRLSLLLKSQRGLTVLSVSHNESWINMSDKNIEL